MVDKISILALSYYDFVSGIHSLFYFGGFSTVLYFLKLAMSCCISDKVFGKDLLLRRTTVSSIHSSSVVHIPSYSIFMFSISTIKPMIWNSLIDVSFTV